MFVYTHRLLSLTFFVHDISILQKQFSNLTRAANHSVFPVPVCIRTNDFFLSSVAPKFPFRSARRMREIRCVGY